MGQITSRWKVVDDIGNQELQIHTEDGKYRIFRMCHSGFGVSSDDEALAKYVVELHNSRLERLADG